MLKQSNKRQTTFYTKKYWLGFCTLLLLGISHQSFADKALLKPKTTAQLQLFDNKSQKLSHAILLKTHAEVQANAIVSGVTLTQTFKNKTDNWVEGTYVFPLPEDAAVDKMTLQIGERKIIGKIREKQQAQKIYQAAINNGQKAALLDSSRDNLFTAKAGNIPPHSEITVILHYVKPTHYQAGVFSVRIPTTYTPRYIVKNTLTEEIEAPSHPSQNKLPKAVFTHNSPNRLSLNVNIDAGYKITQISSPNHTFDPHFSDNQQTAIISAKQLSMDKDYQLNWQIAKSEKPLALAFSEKTAQGHFTSLLFMPPQQMTENHVPRETVFIIDTSGSMDGDAIRQAKAGALDALQYLRPEDKFNLIEFDDRYSQLFPHSQLATDENISLAKSFILGLSADGGTEMYAPLQAVLSEKTDSERLRQIVFLTDGAVSNETELFRLIEQQLGKSRLFTVAIGAAPNAFFMKQAAIFGRGSETSISQINEVSGKISALFAQLQHPALTDIEVKLPKQMNTESYPNPIADLYLGHPVIAHIKTETAPQGTLLITGKSTDNNNSAWQHQLTVKESISAEQGALAKLWARKKIDNLNHQAVIRGDDTAFDNELLKIGLDYQLVTKKTAFVAIEESLSRDTLNQALKNKQIANAMPAGNTMNFPTTATSSTLTALLGTLCLLIAVLLALLSHYRREYAAMTGDHRA